MMGAICGGLTGFFVSHPIDLHGFLHTGMTLYKELGFFAFYRGMPWRSTGIVMGAFTI